MKNIQVREAKKMFIKTGRLNKKVISQTISNSWYRCYIAHLDPKLEIQSEINVENSQKYDQKLFDFVHKIMGDHIVFSICNHKGKIIGTNATSGIMSKINNVDELYIGTNAGAISVKTERLSRVALEEHYLDQLSHLYSYAVPIKVDKQVIAYVFLITEIEQNDIELMRLEEKLKHYKKAHEENAIEHETVESLLDFDDFFSTTPSYKAEILEFIKKTGSIRLPILILGTSGSGKSTLSAYLASLYGENFTNIDALNVPEPMQYNAIISALYHNRTVIVENIEYCSEKTMSLLTVYTEEKFIKKIDDKYSKFKCSNIILTTINSDKIAVKKLISASRLVERIVQNSFVMKNLYDFKEESCKLVNNMLSRYDVEFSDDYLEGLVKLGDKQSFKDIILTVKNTRLNSPSVNSYNRLYLPKIEEDKLMSLEELEADYIRKILGKVEYNISLAAEILKISRSTLYRKIDKYKIETDTEILSEKD